MNHLSLFSGIGGIDLAAEWAGFKTVGQCEKDEFCLKVLGKHWPRVPKWKDIRDLTYESFCQVTGGVSVDLISGGYPCIPFSSAGKRRGESDDTYLWPEMFRVVQEFKPTWVIGENVANFANMALETTVINLESEGYEVQSFIIPACAVGAPHERNRCFVVAHLNKKGLSQNGSCGGGASNEVFTRRQNGSKDLHPIALDSVSNRGSSWEVEPRVGRMANGFSGRMDLLRLTALGNAVVPQQIYPILRAIYLIGNDRDDPC